MTKYTCPPVFGCSRRDFLQSSSLALLGLAGSSWPRISGAGNDAVLHIRNYMDLSSLDPVSTISLAEGLVCMTIFQNLLSVRPGSHWETQLEAAEYFAQVSDTRYDFRLRPGQMFTHGYGEMTADDVKFSFERMVDPTMNSINAPEMGPFSHVEVHDRYSGTLVLHSPYSAFLTIAVAGVGGSILSRAAMMDVGGRFSTQPPCCCGPYQFRSWAAQRKTVLERNSDWNGPPAVFAEIHVYAMPDDKAGEMAFEAGQLDCAQISAEVVEPFEQAMPPDSNLHVLPSGRNFWLGMNQQNAALTDIRVRQAIQYAIDVEAVVEAAWFGLAATSNGPIPQGMLGHRPQALIPPRGDPEKARALLKAAGIALPLRLRLDCTTKARDVTAVQVMQWSLRQVGIEVSIRALEPGTFLTIGMEDRGDQWRDVQLFMQDFVGAADPYYSMTWFISEQIGKWNWERFSNAEFDRLYKLALKTSDTRAADRMYQRMQDLMEESGCYRFITNGVMPSIVRNSIKSAFRPDGYFLLREFRPADEPA